MHLCNCMYMNLRYFYFVGALNILEYFYLTEIYSFNNVNPHPKLEMLV